MSNVIGELIFQREINPEIPYAETPKPEINKPSYIITIAPRVKALNEIYNMVKPNGNYQFDHYWNAENVQQKAMIGFIGRENRIYKPIKGSHFIGLFETMEEASNYLTAKEIPNEKTNKKENALVIISKLTYNFLVKPKPRSFLSAEMHKKVKGIRFNSGFRVLQAHNITRDKIYQILTSNSRVILNIFPTYQRPDNNEPVYEFLKLRRQRLFNSDIPYQYKSRTIPEIDITLKEDTNELNGMNLIRVNKCKNDIERVTIQNIIQYTQLKINENGFTSESKVQDKIKEKFEMRSETDNDYIINTSFMIWAEHLDEPSYPLFIGYLNEKNFSKD